MTNKLPPNTLRMGLPSGSLQSATVELFAKAGYKVTIEGLSRSFDQEYWNYAKLIAGVLRLGMPIHHVVNLIEGLNVEDHHINTWKNGVQRALKRHIPDGTKVGKQTCPNCNDAEHLVYKEGCLTCESCGYSKCG